jgi:hypothetical protein
MFSKPVVECSNNSATACDHVIIKIYALGTFIGFEKILLLKETLFKLWQPGYRGSNNSKKGRNERKMCVCRCSYFR